MFSGIIVPFDKGDDINMVIKSGELKYLDKKHKEATAISIPAKFDAISRTTLEKMGWEVSKHPSPPGCIFIGEMEYE